MSASAFLDTNILVYAFDKSDVKRHSRASSLISELLDHRRAVISVQVLKEFFVVVTRKIAKPLSARDAERLIDKLSVLPVVDDTLPLLRLAFGIHRDVSISFWDACIVAAAASSGCDRLYTEDLGHGQVIAGVTVFNPFRA